MISWARAWAQEPSPPEEPPPVDPLEIVVYGELRVKQAKEQVVELLEDMGYGDDVIDRGDHTVYRHSTPWKGEVVVYDDGWVQVKRQPLRVEGTPMPWAERDTPVAWAGCLVWPFLCLKLSGATSSERRWRSIEDDSVAAIDGKVRVWGDRIADLSTDQTAQRLPDELSALWERGEPLGSGPGLGSAEERRRALYDYWATRTDTVWGDAVRDVVEAFCRAVVMPSDAPFTPEELATWAAGTPERPFLRARAEALP